MNKHPHLIILYGRFSDNFNAKQQRMINGECTCGYRDYARKYGMIIYLSPQDVLLGWEKSITNWDELLSFLLRYPDSIIWSVKVDPKKDILLKALPNKKVYYSCCANDVINRSATVSLVDTRERVSGNGNLWFKGKDPDYWYPVSNLKLCDYLLMGRRADKNELWFIEQLTHKVKDQRHVLWIGGIEHEGKIKTHHKITCTPFKKMSEVRDLICAAKIGVLLSEHPAEGFPQSFLEMTMCGVPVVYLDSAPYNKQYFTANNSIVVEKKSAIKAAEFLLSKWTVDLSRLCRKEAVENYSLEKSYESILETLCQK